MLGSIIWAFLAEFGGVGTHVDLASFKLVNVLIGNLLSQGLVFQLVPMQVSIHMCPPVIS